MFRWDNRNKTNIWLWEQENTGLASFSGALYNRMPARNGKGRAQPALGLWSTADAFIESQQVCSCTILPLYQLISLHNLMAVLHLLLGHLAVPVACRESRDVSLGTPGVQSWQGAPCSKKDATDKHRKILTANQHAQRDLLEFEHLPSLQRSPLTSR